MSTRLDRSRDRVLYLPALENKKFHSVSVQIRKPLLERIAAKAARRHHKRLWSTVVDVVPGTESHVNGDPKIIEGS